MNGKGGAGFKEQGKKAVRWASGISDPLGVVGPNSGTSGAQEQSAVVKLSEWPAGVPQTAIEMPSSEFSSDSGSIDLVSLSGRKVSFSKNVEQVPEGSHESSAMIEIADSCAVCCSWLLSAPCRVCRRTVGICTSAERREPLRNSEAVVALVAVGSGVALGVVGADEAVEGFDDFDFIAETAL